MCNCGRKRTENTQFAQLPAVNTNRAIPAQTVTYTSFEYTGRTALTIIGNVTGRKYRFSYSGNRQNIDSRDMAGMMSVPVLKKVGE